MPISVKIFLFLAVCFHLQSKIQCFTDSNTSVNSNALLSMKHSIIYDLTEAAIASESNFDSNQCKEDFLAIKSGIEENRLWTFKREKKIM
jgi:hypothetical protein